MTINLTIYRNPGAAEGAVNKKRVRDLLVSHPGIKNIEIAERLGLSVFAVGRHVNTIRNEWNHDD